MVWSEMFISCRGLREICRKKICEEIFIPLKTEKEFKLLIVDDFALKILSYCFNTEEVLAFNIALFECLDKIREPVPYLSAAYLCFPSAENIVYIYHDFAIRPPMYLNVHLFFLSDVPLDSFDGIAKYASPGFVQSFKEIDIMFFPYESQVFSLNDKEFLPVYFNAFKELDLEHCAFIAKKLATFCATFKAFPSIRYRREFIKNAILAEALERELRFYHESFIPSSVESDTKPRTEILIIDRGFDCVTPLIHDCTFQAMAHDLLDIEDDVYEYVEGQSSNEVKRSKLSLTESDTLWRKLRHKHIAEVAEVIDGMVETHSLLRMYPSFAGYKTLPELGESIRKHLAYRVHQPHGMYRRMANECMKLYLGGIRVVDDVMQDLAFGAITQNSFSPDVRSAVTNILCSDDYDPPEKLRLFLLYIFYAKGITKSEFDNIVDQSQLPFSEARIITNVLHLDVDIFRPGLCQAVDHIPRDDADTTTSPLLKARWLPAIKNVMLSCIDGTLGEDKYPYLDRDDCATRSKRTGYWYTDKRADHASRLIVFIAGGVTYSEMRCAYEVMSLHTGWEVYIGGDSILTPEKFLDKLGELRCFISKNM